MQLCKSCAYANKHSLLRLHIYFKILCNHMHYMQIRNSNKRSCVYFSLQKIICRVIPGEFVIPTKKENERFSKITNIGS